MTNVKLAHDEHDRLVAARPEGPTNFLSKHRKWLAEIAKKKKAVHAELEASLAAQATRNKKFVAYSSTLRDAVRGRQAELAADGLPHAQPDLDRSAAASASAAPAAAAAPAAPAAPAGPAAPPPPSSAKSTKKSTKPSWAMTEDEADEAMEGEAAALVDFAQGLDYEKYMDDLEVRQALDVIRERMDTKKAEEAAAEAMAAAEDEAAAAAAEAYEEGGDWKDAFLATWNAADDDDNERLSQTSTQRRAAAAAEAEGGGDEKPEWDGSTSMGEGGRKKLAAAALAAAKELREMNPKLAEKHSNKSLAQAIETAKKAELAEEFARLPPLKLVTIHENPRVAKGDAVDASNLPYLHRNPAI